MKSARRICHEIRGLRAASRGQRSYENRGFKKGVSFGATNRGVWKVSGFRKESKSGPHALMQIGFFGNCLFRSSCGSIEIGVFNMGFYLTLCLQWFCGLFGRRGPVDHYKNKCFFLQCASQPMNQVVWDVL